MNPTTVTALSTMLALSGHLRDDSNPIPVLWEKGSGGSPAVLAKPEIEQIAVSGATESP